MRKSEQEVRTRSATPAATAVTPAIALTILTDISKYGDIHDVRIWQRPRRLPHISIYNKRVDNKG